ncbi:MAG: type II toxin-antitoxin system PemK/MazF family toxin [Candidatus Tectomicrobia bacterium]|uniref:Type II toxin-antitoxin system PemK/MazF family toxin n=1 Tax=Tectimicrobiota bacterium TaxID=2528274 RepID=A0A937W5A1_UNCTE|nr:type II toxin-antitoxin system PemK/MazF family toxin [Candidatus Tectomicrobia bacterium]
MNVRRGDVVLVVYPFASGQGASRRPALIVQNNRDNSLLDNTVLAQITTNARHANDPTQLLISWETPEGQQAGILHDSVVSCNNLATVRVDRIHRVIGHLSAVLMYRIDACLKAALALR